MITFVIFHVELDRCQRNEIVPFGSVPVDFVDMTQMAFDSARKFHPDCRCVVLTDLDQTFALTPEWKHYELSFTTSKDYPSNGSQIALQVGNDAGTYEFSQFEMMEVPHTP